MSWKVQSFVEVAMITRLFLAVKEFMTEIKNLEGLFWAFQTIKLENLCLKMAEGSWCE